MFLLSSVNVTENFVMVLTNIWVNTGFEMQCLPYRSFCISGFPHKYSIHHADFASTNFKGRL